jgi:internalin A
MASEFDGAAIARERIAKEARQRTGTLDLAGLGLEEIPKEAAALAHLRELDLGWPDGNKVVDASGKSWDTRRNRLADLAPLVRLTALQSLVCSSTRVADLAPLARLTALRSLACSSTQVADLAPLASLTSLQSLDCYDTQVADLAPLAGLTALQSFNCFGTRVADLAPLASLASLQSLNCSATQVADLAPLARLTALQSLNCYNTQVADLAPLASLTSLQSLDCWNTQVADLAPLASLTSLQSLDCHDTQVADLAPLASLTALQSLVCPGTQVADLAPLARLTSLQSLHCGFTRVADLAPLASLTALRSLDCSSTQVADLAPLAGLAALKKLEANRLTLAPLTRVFVEAPQLTRLTLYETRIPDIPAGVLSSTYGENCLPSLRAYFQDSGPDDPRIEDVKLMVLGNGRVGKTQLCRNLTGEPFEPDAKSTHGVTIKTVLVPRQRGGPPIPLHIWDFGGQDIYHGTHALFLRDHAIFALVWAKGFEERDPEGKDGEIFGRRPLRYWVDYVRHLSGKDRAAVLVQTRCDAPQDKAPCPVPEAELAEAFGLWPRVDFSAATPRGEASLREALVEAAEFALQREGAPRIPTAWRRVEAALERLRDEDQKRPIGERRHRTLTPGEFAAICRKQGVESEPKHLLRYLHRTGVVFHRPDLMAERIVLDQAWALEAIYAVFERGRAYSRIKGDRGRFRPSDLAITAWKDRSQSERALFLDMMRSCGVCFQLRAGDRDADEEPVYVAPELLPTREKVKSRIDELWNTGDPVRERRYKFPFLHDGLIRAVISAIGDVAGVDGVYWRDGVGVYEERTQSRALIEQIMGAGWSGEIVVQTRGGRAEELLARLCEIVDRTRQRIGLEGKVEESAKPTKEPEGTKAPLAFTADPNAKPRYYVSYAWADKANPDREKEVDATCAEAERRGTPILRDKTAMRLGDSISEFMAAIGRGDRVFVFLSAKYLKSDFCMTELTRLWIDCRTNPQEFKRRSRVFVLPDAKIRAIKDRAALAAYWSDRAAKLLASAIGPTGTRLGDEDYAQLRWIELIAHHVGDILHLFADAVQPKDFAEFIKYGFDDPPAGKAG